MDETCKKVISLSSIPHRLKNTINSINNIARSVFVTEQDSRQIYWILAVITLCGLILRVLVMNRPIGYDEAYTFIYFASRPFKYILADYHAPNNHILNSILIGVAYRILGSHVWIVRVPAFIASVLCIPAAYFMARRFYTSNQALAASAVLAIYPSLIQSTANGRGYMLVILFSLLLANIAGALIYKQDRAGLIAFAVTAALGFYAVPIFLYPMAGISLWAVTTYLISAEPWQIKLNHLAVFLVTCIGSGLLTLVFYSPVILFGTGLDSIINNEIVTSRSWSYFFESLNPRITRTWADWTVALSPAVKYLLSGGFLLSVIFHRKASSQRLPLQLFLFLAIAILLVVQRVAPLPRIWIYLEIFCVIFSVAGLTWFMAALLKRTVGQINIDAVFPPIILLFTITIFVNSIRIMRDPAAVAERGKMPEQYAADYLTDHLKPGDTILSIAPVDIRTAYYLKINGVSYDVFYQRDHPVEFQNALVIFRHREERNTPEKVVDFFQLLPKLDMASAELVYEYGELQIYSIPANE
jgi:dolichyl-phosphate-mannose-protein mannosyltransferase